MKIKPGILIILTVMFVVVTFLPVVVPPKLLLGKLDNFMSVSGILLILLLPIIIILSFFTPRRWAIIVWIVLALTIAIALIPATSSFKKHPPQRKGAV